MTWGFQLDIPSNARGENIDAARPYHSRVVTAGKRITALRRNNGNPIWIQNRFGIMLQFGHSSKLFWNAKRDTIKTNEQWSRLMRQRIAIPVTAYVENAPDRRWYIGERGWIPGLVSNSHDGGIVTINNEKGSPIILEQNTAIEWLDVPAWNALEKLDENNIQFNEADPFEYARLNSESSTKVPIAA